MLSWLIVGCGFLVLGAIIICPGAWFLKRIGYSGHTALAAGPAVFVGICGILQVLFPFWGIPWTLGTVLVLEVIFVIVGYFLGTRVPFSIKRHKKDNAARDRMLIPLLSTAVVCVVFGIIWGEVLPTADSFIQNHDNMLHLNLVHDIAQTGNASPLTAASAISGTVYPSLWHSFPALIVPFIGTERAVNAMILLLFGI